VCSISPQQREAHSQHDPQTQTQYTIHTFRSPHQQYANHHKPYKLVTRNLISLSYIFHGTAISRPVANIPNLMTIPRELRTNIAEYVCHPRSMDD
jgi:hypothetical protein